MDNVESLLPNTTDIASIETNLNSSFTGNSQSKKKIYSSAPTNINLIKMISNEIKQKASRENNIIIDGLPVINNDNQIVKTIEELFTSMNCSIDTKEFNVERLKLNINATKKTIPSIRVSFLYHSAKLKILKGTKALSSTIKYKNVYLNQDLTILERNDFNKLRMKRNEMNKQLGYTGLNNLKYGIINDNGVDRKYYNGIRGNEIKKIFIKN